MHSYFVLQWLYINKYIYIYIYIYIKKIHSGGINTTNHLESKSKTIKKT